MHFDTKRHFLIEVFSTEVSKNWKPALEIQQAYRAQNLIRTSVEDLAPNPLPGFQE